jgi:hypothetical protein
VRLRNFIAHACTYGLLGALICVKCFVCLRVGVADVILDKVPPPKVLGGEDAPFRLLVSQMDFDNYVGKLVIGRVVAGTVKPGECSYDRPTPSNTVCMQSGCVGRKRMFTREWARACVLARVHVCTRRAGDPIVSMTREGLVQEQGKVTKMFQRRGSVAVPLDRAVAGDIIQLAGLQVGQHAPFRVPLCTVQCSAVLCSVVLNSAVLCRDAMGSGVQCNAVQCCTVLCYAGMWCDVICCSMQCNAVLCLSC